MRAPEFWDRKTDGLMPSLLRPLGCAVSAMAALRQKKATPYKASVPIICVGNLVAGGAGKTPVALDLVARLKSLDVHVHVLLRGYGGTERGPTQVDLAIHNARRVGDEALLLAKVAPTWVSEDRKAGVLAAIEAGAQAIVLDDGFQNPSVHKDLSLLVVDGEYGFGNGRVMPAGPLRETVGAGLKRADSIVLLGSDGADVWGKVQRAGHKKMPILRARIEATPDAADLKGQDVYAFAGIGRPQKFFDTLSALGAKLVGCKAFDDHHPYTDTEIEDIIKGAGEALILTTTKDLVRIPQKHQGNMRALDIRLAWKHSDDIDAALKKVMTDG
ncbi:MAG: tetraacyldisaccharide 4'-kinase [Rhodospirillaceae bacterium]|nr:MAG: tetraacyldisaccharide 4'-kinase [Rhodospirillaceae bacterium]